MPSEAGTRPDPVRRMPEPHRAPGVPWPEGNDMRHPWGSLALVPALAACGTPDRPELDYLPPSGAPVGIRGAFVQQQPWLVWGNLLDHLQQRGLQVAELDEPSGEIVVTYSGDPE